MKVLVLFAHPALERSRVNRELLAALRDRSGVTLHDLYEEYPDLQIDVQREQELLLAHDVVILHHPFFWYSAPAIVKEWQDLVLEHGWAYGSEGRALEGKVTFNVLSAGGSEAAYQDTGFNRFTVRQLLSPFEATANLCRMTYLPPFVLHGALQVVEDQIEPFARDYGRLLDALVEGRLDIDRARDPSLLYLDPDALIRPAGGGLKLVSASSMSLSASSADAHSGPAHPADPPSKPPATPPSSTPRSLSASSADAHSGPAHPADPPSKPPATPPSSTPSPPK